MAPRERVKEICSLISPLLTAAAGVPAMMLMPLPRWPDGPCCSREGHMVGYNSERHISNLLSKLEAIRRGVRDFVRLNKIDGVRVASPAKTVLEAPGPWSSPISPNIGAYQALLAKALDELASRNAEGEQAKYHKRTNSEGGPPGKRPYSGPQAGSSVQERASGPDVQCDQEPRRLNQDLPGQSSRGSYGSQGRSGHRDSGGYGSSGRARGGRGGRGGYLRIQKW